ncbi:PREDICTED: solute carrier family 35 member E2-like isoform X1 [Priapulus caudatus]|uniref:Solute carrier family 35 member E2-like isoform X1 n=1 Tax=Priapulus caudatus TaxID=37621 RepID=A0ABM1EXP6_PRICU|nr:PREDICTED: solute carrier family 35 member E2-like isoform X1 [Priapulus caudatus]XP_014676966.1 PREDICTED: solute carrier family 35 member E2-like isoform X1 [Priapulus caudatus]XP_014676967.1 PREDICTED: solute carrier family 35 member E2-like isoform X1 [Priapulus caudatus]
MIEIEKRMPLDMYNKGLASASDMHVRGESHPPPLINKSVSDGSLHRTSDTSKGDILPDHAKSGLCNAKAMIFLVLWYLFSFCNLFMNKFTIDTLKGDATLLGVVQMCTCISGGFVQLHFPCGMYTLSEREERPPSFLRNMLILGTMRFITVILGLVALKFVAVSFTETVKSSAPIFTVLLSRAMLGERTGICVSISLIPVMAGLFLCSATELSFNLMGFLAALATNLSECTQNVFSKMLRSDKRYQYSPAELQFFSSSASMLVELPTIFLMIDITQLEQNMTHTLAMGLLANGLFFHFQTITEYVLIGYISPVTHSVANTVKRALLIWLSVIVFGNPVSFLSGLGTTIVLAGVLLYNQARECDQARLIARRKHQHQQTEITNAQIQSRQSETVKQVSLFST